MPVDKHAMRALKWPSLDKVEKIKTTGNLINLKWNILANESVNRENGSLWPTHESLDTGKTKLTIDVGWDYSNMRLFILEKSAWSQKIKLPLFIQHLIELYLL